MPFTYGDILTAARDGSVWFSHDRIPGGVAARLASDIQRDLVSQCMQRDPERLSTTQTLTGASVVASLGTPPTAIALSPAMLYVRAETVLQGSFMQPQKLTMLTPDRLEDWTYGLGYFLEGASIFFTGQASDWAQVASVRVTYVPFVNDLTAETDLLALPDDAKGAFVSRLMLAFALRVNGMPASLEQPDLSQPIQLDVTAFSATAKDAEQKWLMRLGQQRRQSRLTIRNGADLQ